MREMNDFDAGLSKMGRGIRQAQTGLREADEGSRHADEGFLEALEALKAITLARGSLDERVREVRASNEDLRETLMRLEALVLELVRRSPPPTNGDA